MIDRLLIATVVVICLILGYTTGRGVNYINYMEDQKLQAKACECTEDDLSELSYRMDILNARQDSLTLLAVDQGCGSR